MSRVRSGAVNRAMNRAGASRGFVLVNALVLVAALAAVVVFLLQRSEGLRIRLTASQEAAQLEQYLGAFDALALHLLFSDHGGGADHLGESWALTLPPVVLDRGEVTGDIHDLQGRFNLNWLADPEDTEVAAAFDVLALRLGLSARQAEAVRAFLRPGGAQNQAAYSAQAPAIAPVGGAVLMPVQLRQVPGLSAAQHDRLSAHVAALPGDSQLNINTATPDVLAAMLPAARPALVALILQERRAAPFVSRDDLGARLQVRLGDQALEGLDLERFGIGSSWFGLRSSARLGTSRATRQAVILRLGGQTRPSLVWHLDQWE